MTPFFQASQRSLAYQFTTNVPLMCPPFSIFRQFCIFSLVLAKISALKTQIFQIFVPKTPYFSRKIRSLDPTFENRVAHTHQKKVECPPGTLPTSSDIIVIIVMCTYIIVNHQLRVAWLAVPCQHLQRAFRDRLCTILPIFYTRLTPLS